MNVTQWLESEFFVLLAQSLAHFLWQGLLVAVLATMAAWLLCRASAQSRYLVYLAALLTMGACLPSTFLLLRAAGGAATASASLDLPPAAAASIGPAAIPAVPSAPSVAGSELASPRPSAVAPGTARAVSTSHDRQRLAPYASAAYGAGLTVMVIRLLLGCCGGLWMRRRAVPVTDPHLLAVVGDQARRLRLRFVPAVSTCHRVATPVVVGVLRPAILLPVALTTGLSLDQLENIVTHELAHIRRHDLLVNLLQRLVEAVLFYHPAVWYISRRLSAEREHCCDDIVVAGACDPSLYAESLVRVAELARESRAMVPPGIAVTALASTGRQPSLLRRRIFRLTGMQQGFQLGPSRNALLGFALVVLGVIAIPRVATPSGAPVQDRVEIEPLPDGSRITGPVRYGAVTDRLVRLDGIGATAFLDLDSGRLFSPPEGTGDQDLQGWARETGVDLQLRLRHEAGEATPDVQAFELFHVSGREENWDRADARGLLEWFGWEERRAAPLRSLTTADRTVTFQTREGAMGRLQILGAAEDQAGVRLRHKLVQARVEGTDRFVSHQLEPTALRLAALESLRRHRRTAPGLLHLLQLNGDETPDIERLGHPTGAAGIEEVAEIRSAGRSYTAVVARRYPKVMPRHEVNLGLVFLFDELGNLVARFGGELGPDGVNGDDVMVTSLGTDDRWFVAVSRFEEWQAFTYRTEVYVLEPGFPLAFRMHHFPNSMAWTGKRDREGSYFWPHGLPGGKTFSWAEAEAQFDEVPRILWDSAGAVFRGRGHLSYEGQPSYWIDPGRSTRFEATDGRDQ